MTRFLVLEEACLKQGFEISGHQLRHQNRLLDLSLPVRLSDLPNNATVELIPSTRGSISTEAQIALQLADGSRFIGTFSNKTNLLDILQKFSKESGTDLVKYSDGRIPSCTYMNRELADGSRFIGTFSNKTNLLDILQKFSKESGTDLVKYSDGRIPSCTYMNREVLNEHAKE
ncbi:unnamed protein product [Gongylonema pulchrum]|uniref:TUG-UBL1 domain-containing protein n=1 Tax=Gongylonema pulchrum TaxID=637853 RepID=A0A183EAZ9_9BILA|nr:unnamed protein product [Gongylonema pulchrum]